MFDDYSRETCLALAAELGKEAVINVRLACYPLVFPLDVATSHIYEMTARDLARRAAHFYLLAHKNG